MPIIGVEQPESIMVDDRIRLRKYDGNYDFALQWYQNKETLLLVDGKEEPYTIERLKGMYNYLDARGELYFIEYKAEEEYIPIGDVTFWEEDMPIVIGDKAYRGQGIGYKVITTLIERAKALGYQRIYVDEIYDNNTGSQTCFEKAGFKIYEKTEKGNKYCLNLQSIDFSHTVTAKERTKRKLIYLPSRNATDYFSYCEEMGCEWGEILNSIPEKYDTAALIELPDSLVEEGMSKTASGVEVPFDYDKPVPESYKIAELPACTMLYFQSQPYENEEDFCEAIESTFAAVGKYHPELNGYRFAYEIAPAFNFGAEAKTGARLAVPAVHIV